jgi:hypothetical protein
LGKDTEKWIDHSRDLFKPGTRVTFKLGGQWRWGWYVGYHALRGKHKVSNKKRGKAGYLVPNDIEIWEVK